MAYKPEIDILKGIAIVAVVGIHFISSLSLNISDSTFFLAVNQLARYSVPLFVFLSGYGLATKYKEQPLSITHFFKRRVFKIVPPYIFWSIIIYTLVHLYGPWSSDAQNYGLITAILLGKADYQLYFVPMIFQLYMLFPWLLKLVKRFPPVAITALAFSIQAASFYIMQQLGWRDQIQYTVSLGWIGYFILGINIGLARFIHQFSRRRLGLLVGSAMALGAFWTIHNAQHLISQGINVIEATRFTRTPVLIYASLSILTLYLARLKLLKLPQPLYRTLKVLGRHSYVIFLSHTIVLRVLTELLSSRTSVAQLLVTIFA